MAVLTLTFSDGVSIDCSAAIFVPEQALQESGYIKMMTGHGTAADKHSMQALAQTAFYQFQDAELDVAELVGACRLASPNGEEELARGMVIYRASSGVIGAAVHGGLNRRKLLEAAHRYCTRWVRLDI